MGLVWVDMVCLAVLGSLIAWDIYLATDRVRRNTISERIRRYARKTWLIPASCGVLLGHWFHPFEDGGLVRMKPVETITALCFVGLTFLAIPFFIQRRPRWGMIVSAAVGTLAGIFFWPV